MVTGRPSVYNTKIKPNLKAIQTLRANGFTIESIADTLGISRSVLYKHRADYPDFMDNIKKGTENLVEEGEAKLYDLALGRVQSKKTKILYDSEGNMRSKEVTEEILPPDKVALFFMLTNLAGDKWRHKVDNQIDGEVIVSSGKTFTQTFEEEMKKRNEENSTE